MPKIDAARALNATEQRLKSVLKRVQSTLLFRTQRALERPRPKKSSIAPDVDDITYTRVLIDHQLARIGYDLEALDEEAAFDLALKFIQLHMRFALKREAADALEATQRDVVRDVSPIAQAIPGSPPKRSKKRRRKP
jgi:hypothetical protein